MAKTYNRLELDVNKKPNSIGIRPVQNDTKSRYLDVCLYENGVPINLTGEPRCVSHSERRTAAHFSTKGK